MKQITGSVRIYSRGVAKWSLFFSNKRNYYRQIQLNINLSVLGVEIDEESFDLKRQQYGEQFVKKLVKNKIKQKIQSK